VSAYAAIHGNFSESKHNFHVYDAAKGRAYIKFSVRFSVLYLRTSSFLQSNISPKANGRAATFLNTRFVLHIQHPFTPKEDQAGATCHGGAALDQETKKEIARGHTTTRLLRAGVNILKRNAASNSAEPRDWELHHGYC